MKNDTDKISKFVRYALAAYYKRGYVGAILSGEFAKGKTVTALKIGAKILQGLHPEYTDEQALDIIIDEHLIFTSDEFLKLTDRLYSGYDWENMDYKEVLKTKFNIRYPVLIWDDAGIHASSKKEVFDKSDAFDIQSEYDTIRDITSCMILTVPEEGELMKFLRTYRSNYFIELAYPHERSNTYDRIMYFYRYERDNKTGNMKRRLKWKIEKPHNVHLEDWYYGKYDKKRTLAKLEHSRKYKQKAEEREIIKKYKLIKRKRLVEQWSKELETMT